jgi:hypothetical protein
MALRRADVADAAVAMLDVVPVHEVAPTRARPPDPRSPCRKLRAGIWRCGTALRVGVVVADPRPRVRGLTPSQCSIASTVVALSVAPLSPCRTGLSARAGCLRPAPCGAPGGRRVRPRRCHAPPSRRSCGCRDRGSGTG